MLIIDKIVYTCCLFKTDENKLMKSEMMLPKVYILNITLFHYTCTDNS